MAAPKSYKQYTDEELLQFFRSSSDNAFLGALLQRYTLLLLGVALKYLRDKDEAQDAVQQVFLKAISNFPKGAIQNFKGWLYVLTRNYCLQLLRNKPYFADVDAVPVLAQDDTDKEALHLHDFTLEQLQDALQELNEEQRVCVSLFYLQKKSYKQIEQELQLDFAQVKSNIQNGKRNLKQFLLKKIKDFGH